MDPPLVAFANLACILGVIFTLFASIVDSTEQWQEQPVLSQPLLPNYPQPQPEQWQEQPVLPQPLQPNLPQPQPQTQPQPQPQPQYPPSLFIPATPLPPSSFVSAPPPQSSKPEKPSHPFAPAPAPQASPPNGRPFVSAPPPVQDQQAYPNVVKTDDDIRNDLGRKIGCIFAGVAIIMQVIVTIFLIIKRRLLFNPDYVY